MAFQSFKMSKISGWACPQTTLATGVSGARLACLPAHKFLATAMLTTPGRPGRVFIWQSSDGNKRLASSQLPRALLAAMHFPFYSQQRAQYDHPIRQMVPYDNWKQIRGVVFRNQVTVKLQSRHIRGILVSTRRNPGHHHGLGNREAWDEYNRTTQGVGLRRIGESEEGAGAEALPHSPPPKRPEDVWVSNWSVHYKPTTKSSVLPVDLSYRFPFAGRSYGGDHTHHCLRDFCRLSGRFV